MKTGKQSGPLLYWGRYPDGTHTNSYYSKQEAIAAKERVCGEGNRVIYPNLNK